MDRDLALPDRLLRRMLDLLEEARRNEPNEVPPSCLVQSLAELVPGIGCLFVEQDVPTRRELTAQYTPTYGDAEPEDDEPDIWWRLRRQHPNVVYRERTGRLDVVQVSDFVGSRQLHHLAVYQEYMRFYGVEHVMTVPLPAPPGRARAYQFDRGSGLGFTETERAMLTLLQPHLHQIYREAAARRRTPVRLTIRQLDVLRCVALGMSNDQISRQLVIAPGTVTKHLENIYTRLGVSSRTGAIAQVFGGNEHDVHKPAEDAAGGMVDHSTRHTSG